MPLNSTIKTRLEEVARPVWILGADGEPIGIATSPLHITGSIELESESGVVDDVYALLKGYRSSDGTYQPLRLDKATNTMQTIDYAHHEIHAGSHFFVTDYQTINSGNSVDWMGTTPDTTKWGHMLFDIGGSAITTIQLYEGGDRVGTIPLTAYNSNRNSGTLAAITAHRGTGGGTTDGVLIFQASGGAASGNYRIPISARQDDEIILKRNTKYILRITSGTNGNIVTVKYSWYEHTDVG